MLQQSAHLGRARRWPLLHHTCARKLSKFRCHDEVTTRVTRPLNGDDCKGTARVFCGQCSELEPRSKCRLDMSTACCLSNTVLRYRVALTSGDGRKGNEPRNLHTSVQTRFQHRSLLAHFALLPDEKLQHAAAYLLHKLKPTCLDPLYVGFCCLGESFVFVVDATGSTTHLVAAHSLVVSCLWVCVSPPTSSHFVCC